MQTLGRARHDVRRAVAMSLIIFLMSWTMVLAQPAWQPVGQPNTARINDSTWTTSKESREYTKEDGTKVTENRTTTVKKTEGKTEYTEVETVTKEQKGEDKAETRTKEKTDSTGKKTSIVQKFTTTKNQEGTKHTSEFWENGKLVGSGTSTTFDPPKADGTVTEEESISYDKDGKPIKKTKYRYRKDGVVLIDEYMWDPKTGTWGPSTGTKVIMPAPAKVVAPSTSTSGYAVGGTVKQEEIKSTAGGTIVAEKTDGEKHDIEFNMGGRWEIPAGVLSAGIWLISALMPDGTKGLPSILQVLPKGSVPQEPDITGVPGLGFTGSTLTLAGSGLMAGESTGAPEVWFSGSGEPFSEVPLAYSDREIVCQIPTGSITGETNVFVNNGKGFSNALKTDIVSFEIIVPAVTKVGQPFNVTVRLTGLTGEYAAKEFTAVLNITGPARFLANMGQEVSVTLKNGSALVAVVADSTGAFSISGRLTNLP